VLRSKSVRLIDVKQVTFDISSPDELLVQFDWRVLFMQWNDIAGCSTTDFRRTSTNSCK